MLLQGARPDAAAPLEVSNFVRRILPFPLSGHRLLQAQCLQSSRKRPKIPKKNRKSCIFDVIHKVRETTLLFFNIFRTLFPAFSSHFPRRGTRLFGSHRLRTEFLFPPNNISFNLIFWDANLSVRHT